MGNFQISQGISGTVIHKRHIKLTFILKSEEFFLRHSIHVSDKHVFSSSKWFLVNLKTFGSRIFSPKMLLNNSKNVCDSNFSKCSGKLLNKEKGSNYFNEVNSDRKIAIFRMYLRSHERGTVITKGHKNRITRCYCDFFGFLFPVCFFRFQNVFSVCQKFLK